jgi:hypothetical protein
LSANWLDWPPAPKMLLLICRVFMLSFKYLLR